MKFQKKRSNVKILLINDDKLTQNSLYELLSRYGYNVDIASCPEEALLTLDKNSYNIILSDINDKRNSPEAIQLIKDKAGNSAIIVLTSYGNTSMAQESIKLGALDYLVRPIEDKKIISAIEKALKNNITSKKGETASRIKETEETSYYGLVGQSNKLKEIYSIVERVSNSKTTIILRGESGTGKRLLAQSIHKADKKRRNKPFIEVSCGALPREIIESELFGHTKGAFTGAINDRKGRFELADGGTILLDDIESLPLDLQVKLLRVLQQKEFERVGDHKTMKVDVRIISTTNQNLEKLVTEKKFREDLYYRLNVISLEIPPLRQRKEDLYLLMNHFTKLYSRENNKKPKQISQEAVKLLIEYNWPGNVRELENIIERAVIIDTDDVIEKDDLPEVLISKAEMLTEAPEKEMSENSLKDILKNPEKGYILKVLKEVGWNKNKAAKKLGINRTTLYNKLHKYNLVSETAFEQD